MIDEVAPSADNLTDKHGYYHEVDDVEVIGLLFVAQSEEYRAEQTAHETADNGYTALPYRNDMDELFPTVIAVVSEVFVPTRNAVQKSCKDDCKRNEPQEQFHGVVGRKPDFFCLPASVKQAEQHTRDYKHGVPLHGEIAYLKGDFRVASS